MKQPVFSEVSSRVTKGVRISVRSIFLPTESSPADCNFVFAYQVRIENESNDEVQLVSRKWNITDGNGVKREVKGDGVVGLQPTLVPGAMHEYVSGCDFKTPIGKMEGYFTMIRAEAGESFRVQIPPFILSAPAILN